LIFVAVAADLVIIADLGRNLLAETALDLFLAHEHATSKPRQLRPRSHLGVDEIAEVDVIDRDALVRHHVDHFLWIARVFLLLDGWIVANPRDAASKEQEVVSDRPQRFVDVDVIEVILKGTLLDVANISRHGVTVTVASLDHWGRSTRINGGL
jgi:hypothetical protein